MPPKGPPKPPSKRQVTCSECDKTVERLENLQRHYEKYHPGKPCRLKDQGSIIDFMKTGAKRPLPCDEVDSSESSSSVTVSQTMNSDNDPPVLESDLSEGHRDSAVVEMEQPSANLPPQHSVPRAPLAPDPPTNHLSESDINLFTQIQNVLAQFSPVTISANPIPSPPSPQLNTSPTSQVVDEKETQTKNRILACRSLKDIENLLDDCFKLERENDMIICIACKDSSKPSSFHISEVEIDRLPTKSRKLRNLQSHLVAHLSTENHKKQETQQQEEAALENKRQQRNKEIGRKLGSLAYFIFHNKLPFLFFEKILPWMALMKIDIGQINHSRWFIQSLLTPCFSELKKRLQQHLNKPLPCTDELRPLNITADKGTIKHDCSQVTMIRTPSLKNGHLFERFFVANPDVHCHKGREITELLLQVCFEQLNLSPEDLRQRFSGGTFDGQYLHLNVPKHMADILHLPPDFLEDAIIWDAAHRLELACEDVKTGKKDSSGNWVITPTPWLQELDSALQFIMKNFHIGKNHSDLRSIAKEMGEIFLEFCLFIPTRFIEYAHRTYYHYIRMIHILFEKMKRDEANAVSRKESDNLENLEKLLVQAKTVTDLLFMNEVSQLMTFCSKSFQRFDNLPFETLHAYEHLCSHLLQAQKSFEKQKIPDTVKIMHPNSKVHNLWELFKTSVQTICDSQTFKGIPLLVPGDRGRVTRSGKAYGYQKEEFSALVLGRFKHYGDYLGKLLHSLKIRYEPWPNWLLYCEDTFNFSKELTLHERETALKKLMNCPFGPTPLIPDEKKRIAAEYLTFSLNAEKAMSALHAGNSQKVTQTELWYELLTNENHFKHCKKLIAFALSFLNRSFNESIVEVEVSSLNKISTEDRPLQQKTTEMLNFVSTNGPHPLLSVSLVDDFLDAHFGKNWHFTTNQSQWFISKTVDRHFREAKELSNSLE